MTIYQTNAIVLKREDIFEADRIYYLYTKDFGKIKALAGSVRKINAKLSGHLEPFNLIWAELATKRNGDLFITTALSHKELFRPGVSPAKITLFSKMADFTLKMLRGPQKDSIIWNFMLDNFINADFVETGGTDKFLSEFKNNFIKIMGFGDNFEEAKFYLNDFGI